MGTLFRAKNYLAVMERRKSCISVFYERAAQEGFSAGDREPLGALDIYCFMEKVCGKRPL